MVKSLHKTFRCFSAVIDIKLVSPKTSEIIPLFSLVIKLVCPKLVLKSLDSHFGVFSYHRYQVSQSTNFVLKLLDSHFGVFCYHQHKVSPKLCIEVVR